jgi:hypothetical protein
MPIDPSPQPSPPARYDPAFTGQETPPRKPKNGLILAGFAGGTAALGVAFVPIIGIAALPLAIIGLSLSIIGLIKIRNGTADRKGMAIGGLTLSIAGLLASSLPVYTALFASGAAGLRIPAVAGDRHTVEFFVTASGGAVIRYGTLGAQRSEVAPASTDPWRGTASYNSGSFLLTVTADTRNSTVSNQISCSIEVDGTKVAENNGQTIALCTANVG